MKLLNCNSRCAAVFVRSLDYFDGVHVARAAVRFGGASARGGAVALLGGASKLSCCGLADGQLRE